MRVILLATLFAMSLSCTRPPSTDKAPTPAADVVEPGSVTPEAPRATLYELPRDGLAEVARYRFEKEHYGVPLSGRATMLTVRETLDPITYVKTNKGGGVPAVKVMLMKTLPSMNWDHRDNFGLYVRDDLAPLRLAITGEEWCGNNYLEWRTRGDQVQLLGRAYTDDLAPVTATHKVAPGYYLYEQMPVLVRAALTAEQPVKVRIVGPQTPYLPPHRKIIEVSITRGASETLEVPAGSFETVLVTVEATSPTEHFPSPERYWLAKEGGFIVKAQRLELGTQKGHRHVGIGTYTLLDHRRAPYWGQPVPPATTSLPDRQRATHSSWVALNINKFFAEEGGGTFDVAAMQKRLGADFPGDYLTDPKGVRTVSAEAQGKGGWYVDSDLKVGGRAGGFTRDTPPAAQ